LFVASPLRSQLYIVMEHCAGGDLASLIKRHRTSKKYLEETFIWRVLGQVVSALKECHRHKENGVSKPILHRDLKPANILLDKNMNAKLCDFGLATELAGTNKLAQTVGVGTPYYMSPELVNNQRYDERSDIWSVGCIIYELAALCPPFDAANQLALAVKINSGKIAKLPSCFSEELHRSCHWMLRRDISRRPRVEDLERLPNLAISLRETRLSVKEIEISNLQGKLSRDRAALDEQVKKKERELKERESVLREREKALVSFEKKLKEREEAVGVASVTGLQSAPLALSVETRNSKKRRSSGFSVLEAPEEVVKGDRMNGKENDGEQRGMLGEVDGNVAPPPPPVGKMGLKSRKGGDFDSYKRRKTELEGGR